MKKYIKYSTQKAEETEDRVLTFIGSTEDLDRDREVIKLSAWKLKQYKKNPIVLVNHNPYDLPVARTKKVWIDKDAGALKFDIEFPTPDVSPQGDTLYKLYKNGFMNATSVGFSANRERIDYGDTTKGEPLATFNDVELLELSLVSIPANPAALISSKSFKDAIAKGVVDEAEITDLEIWFQKFIDDDEDEIKDSVKNDKENINKDNTLSCECCGKVLKSMCPDCLEQKDSDNYFEKLYDDILTDRKEVSA